jgi:hypothetical protein
MADKKDMGLASEKMEKLRSSGMQVDKLSDKLKAQVAQLDDEEIAVLHKIKSKLNDGLAADLQKEADTVGGFVW